MLENKINELINESCIVEISGFTDVSNDSYSEGCGSIVNYFDNDRIKFTLNTLVNFKEIIKAKILDYLENNIYFFDKVSEDYFTICDDRLCICQQVNNNNREPTDNEYKLFKQDKITLYIQDISIYISVNGTNFNEDILREIYPKAC